MSIDTIADNKFLIAGYTNSFGNGKYDCYIIKIDSIGDTLWTKTHGGIEDDKAYGAVQTHLKNNYLIAGYSESFSSYGKDGYVFKINDDGIKQWQTFWGGPGEEKFYDIKRGNGDIIVFAGYTTSYGNGGSEGYAVTVDDLGYKESKTYGNNSDDIINTVNPTSDNGFIFCGSTQDMGPNLWDIYLIKTDTGLITPFISSHVTFINNIGSIPVQIDVFPNPAVKVINLSFYLNQSGYVRISLTNLSGNTIFDNCKKFDNGKHSETYNVESLPNGIYLINLNIDNKIYSRKILVQDRL